MSKSFVYKRFGVYGKCCAGYVDVEPESDGEYVLAQDALDREAVLQARIRTLETQLKDAKTRAHEFDNLLDWGLSVFGVSGWESDPWAVEARKLLGREEPNCLK